jgi:hypothetical protein
LIARTNGALFLAPPLQTSSFKNDGVAADRESIKTALKTWTGGEASAARKLKLFEDRLVDLARERLATFN